MDEILEEVYTLLDLYFRIETGRWIVRTCKEVSEEDPVLNRQIYREEILEKIIEKLQELPSL